MIFHAPKSTHVVASSTDSLIAGGSTIKVLGIVVEGTSAGQVIVEAANTSTVILKISTPANDSVIMNIPFVADAGIQITTPSGVTATVFHTQIL